MKKLKTTLLLALLSVLLWTSCGNQNADYFVSGKFQSNGADTIYYLEVQEISYENYIMTNNINVVKDDILKENNYFALNFYKLVDDNQERINLINVIPAQPNGTMQPIYYIDDKGIEIYPFYPTYMYGSSYYFVCYETERLYFERIE